MRNTTAKSISGIMLSQSTGLFYFNSGVCLSSSTRFVPPQLTITHGSDYVGATRDSDDELPEIEDVFEYVTTDRLTELPGYKCSLADLATQQRVLL